MDLYKIGHANLAEKKTKKKTERSCKTHWAEWCWIQLWTAILAKIECKVMEI